MSRAFAAFATYTGHILKLTPTRTLFQGIMHTSKPVFTAQFHPEAFGGPTDTEVFYELVFYVSGK